MSLIQIEVEDDRARCAVDTRITRVEDPNTPTPESSKMCAIPHAGCLVAGRGGIAAFWTLSSAIPCLPWLRDFDSITERMPSVVEWIAQNARIPADGFEPVIEFFVIGWSDASQRMSLAVFNIDLRNNLCVRTSHDRGVVGPPPSDGCTHRYRGMATDDAMHELAQLQLQNMAEIAPDEVTGGRLLVAEVTRHEIRIHDAGPITPE